MPARYVPFLRTKSGEATALRNLTVAAKARIHPALSVVENPPETFTDAVIDAWANRPLALSGLYNLGVTGSTAAFSTMFAAFGRGNIQVIPVAEYSSPQPYLTVIGRLIDRFGPGLMVVVDVGQLPNLAQWIAAQGWQSRSIDLVVSAGYVAVYQNAVQFAQFVSHALNAFLQQADDWRSITLASASAPRDFSQLPNGQSLIPRYDWALWNAVRPHIATEIDFGDFGIVHPDMTEPPGVAMARASVSVRYTLVDDWLWIKGHPTGGARGQPMGQQYRQHSRALANHAQFGGVPGCWADARIQEIASTAVGSGNRTTWVALGLNRHLSMVSNQLP